MKWVSHIQLRIVCVFVRVVSESTAGQSSVHGVSLHTYQKKLWPQW